MFNGCAFGDFGGTFVLVGILGAAVVACEFATGAGGPPFYNTRERGRGIGRGPGEKLCGSIA